MCLHLRSVPPTPSLSSYSMFYICHEPVTTEFKRGPNSNKITVEKNIESVGIYSWRCDYIAVFVLQLDQYVLESFVTSIVIVDFFIDLSCTVAPGSRAETGDPVGRRVASEVVGACVSSDCSWTKSCTATFSQRHSHCRRLEPQGSDYPSCSSLDRHPLHQRGSFV